MAGPGEERSGSANGEAVPPPRPAPGGSGIAKRLPRLAFMILIAVLFRQLQAPPPKICGSPGGPPVTGTRIRLKDGRHLAYHESGVPKEQANHKIIFVHGFDSCRYDALQVSPYVKPGLNLRFHYRMGRGTTLTRDSDVSLETLASQELAQELGVYILSFDRPGYGESDPHPERTEKSTALDIEELADALQLGHRFYLVGFSMGGEIMWSCLKHIPHRLSGVSILGPVGNYWWSGYPSNVSWEAWYRQIPQDQWAVRVAHHAPWLTYWWNTQKLFPASSVIAFNPAILSREDMAIVPKFAYRSYAGQVRQQGEHESLHRDMNVGFGKWGWSPLEMEDPFPGGEAEVHLWHGAEDLIVPVGLSRYIAKTLQWVRYHELPTAGHLFPIADGMGDVIIRSMVLGDD